MVDRNQISPVLIPVYDRYIHFEKVINTLSKCHNSDKTELYIYIDFAKSNQVLECQNSILNTISDFEHNFKLINVIQRSFNMGAQNNILDAIDDLFRKYKSIIFLEDDCIVHPSFLNFLNSCLNKYADNEDILGVSGYLYPINYPVQFGDKDIVKLPYSSAWGMGLWESKYSRPELKSKQILSLIKQKKIVTLLKNVSNRHHYVSLKEVFFKRDRWGDFCFMLSLLNNDKKWIFPVHTLVKNIGADGSGVHQGAYNFNIIDSQILPKNLNLNFNLSEDHNLRLIFQSKIKMFFKNSLKGKIVYFFLKTWFNFAHGIPR